MTNGRPIRVLATLVVLAASPVTWAQNFYQVSNPRTYRINPDLAPPLPGGLVPQMLASRSIDASGAGDLILSWQTPDGQPSAVVEVAVNVDTLPPADSANDAVLISQIPAIQALTAMDCQSDQQVAVTSRTVGRQQGLIGFGVFLFNQQNSIQNVALSTQVVPPLVTNGLGSNAGPQGIAFGGLRNIAGGVYTTGMVMFANDPAGLWAIDVTAGKWLDANTGITSGANPITPIVPWSGDTGAVNLDPGGHQLRGVDVIGDIAFMLTTRQRDPADPASIEYYLVQVDLLVQQLLAVVNLGDLFDSRITAPSTALGGDLDVTARADGSVRILFSTPGSSKYIGAIDGQLVPAGSSPIAGGSTPTPQGPAVVWVCPGFGIAIPIAALATGLWLAHAAWRRKGPY